MSYLNLASIRLCTESEGPGKRLAIWVQGCERRCKGCCNPTMQEIRRNIVVETNDLVNIIRQSKERNDIEGLSFIGGEPFLQSQGLAEIAQWARTNGLGVLVFTGYLIEELKSMGNEDVDRLLQYTDLLVDGSFVEEEYDTERDWVGSKNQRVWYLSDFYDRGIEYEKSEHQMEVMISEEEILVNGWPFV
ncbi:4Fe-4S single cluster domain-containing protein [Roseburia sp. 831b]|uniref:4Fe-4S single cluster domain-containing protein n=1 Tax=Roseburia sp. 831b TaxID=1261635 RepID=UPI0009512661|nr:4Fe-4S single cluster domain-containing protein [Roseburia sp. 831b]WVK74186.1 4Fe-4S single cluster domain-containing protein [Roseburia sp. 831b]